MQTVLRRVGKSPAHAESQSSVLCQFLILCDCALKRLELAVNRVERRFGKDSEFVASQPAVEPRLSEGLPDERGHAYQRKISNLVSKFVVERFEIVQVHDDECHVLSG